MKILSSSLSRIIILFSLAVMALNSSAQETITLTGSVKESSWQTDLLNAVIVPIDGEGNPGDTIPAKRLKYYMDGNPIYEASFRWTLPKADTTLVFEVICDKYMTKTMSYTLDKIGGRETTRSIPTIFLERAPHKLGEVTVTSSKVKFYNKGDTLVYNADAFLLAEGSMLDALISQLPGVELNDNGEIKVNGEKVETLLLNGQMFFDGNNNLMLQNIGAYTVKDVNVYKAESPKDQFTPGGVKPKLLTMDVRLKKDYQQGFIFNSQVGYGTEDRYIGKVFAQWFNVRNSVSLVANVNNLNDNRQPGKNDTWTPEMMPTGTKKFQNVGLTYNHKSADDNTEANGFVIFSNGINNSRTTVNRINFLPGGDTYENIYSNSHMRDTYAQFANYWRRKAKQFFFANTASGIYQYTKNSSAELSGAFKRDPGEMSREILDALYSDGSPELLDSVINRVGTQTDSWRKVLSGNMTQAVSYSIPKSNDGVSANVGVSYRSDKYRLWNDYTVNYGGNASPAVRSRQYTDGAPNHNFVVTGDLTYRTVLFKSNASICYSYNYSDEVKDNYMYALDRLADMGVYGTLPEGYESTFMPDWSYTSRTQTNTHSISPTIMRYSRGLNFALMPSIRFVHRHFDYHRNGRDYPMSTQNTIVNVSSSYGAQVEYKFGYKDAYSWQPANTIRYNFSMRDELPNLFDMVDVVNDADPLNIYLGNPDLKVQHTFANELRWNWTPASRPINNNLLLHHSFITNKLVNGYSYDMSTGVRRFRTYNTSGNWSAQAENTFNWQFGSKKQFTLTSSTALVFSGFADMIGVNSIEPEQTKVSYRSFKENILLAWQIGSHSLQARCDYLNRHTSSSQTGFRTLDANHVNFGIQGTFKLPAGFSLNSDFMCYTRRGYGSKELDTTDPIWNMRLSYAPPRNNHWVFMADAFDLLHQLTNVNYAVTASGRTITYTNTLPRYILVSVQYRFNIQPKKR